jgi:hypothetical protein
MSQDPFPREPLTPEEQALARRLGQLGPHGEPSPALDARILAAARAPQARPAPRARRWPLALGLAASLVLAVGIAWRLRPLPGPPADEAMTRSVATPAAQPNEDANMARNAEPQVGRIPPVPAAAAEATPSRAAREPVADDMRTETTTTSARAIARSAPTSAPTPSAPMPEPTVVLDAPAPAAAPAIATLPPPPPLAAAPDAGAPQPQAAAAATPAPLARKAAPPPTQAEGDAGFDAAAAANAASGDEPPEDVPPATADAPAVREAWLQRIRELLAEGRGEDARASLKEFLHRYPDARLPDDLRALAK